MAEKHTYDVTIGGDVYTVESDKPLTDAEAYSYAKAQAPFDVKAQNATMRANMAKQPPGTGEQDLLTDFATSGPMGNMNDAIGAAQRGEGTKAVHQVVTGVGKVLAPTALPLLATPAGVAALTLGVGGSAVGDIGAREVAKQFTDNPDYVDVAGDVGGLAGGIGGGAAGTKYSGPVLRFLGRSLANPKPLRVQAGEVLADLGKPKTPSPAELGVTPTADAAASRPSASVARTRTPITPQPAQPSVRDMVVSTADAAASMPNAARPAVRVPYNTPPDNPLAGIREQLGLRSEVSLDQLPDVAVAPSTRGPAPQGSGLERNVDLPLHEQQARMDAEQIRSGIAPAEPPPDGRASTPLHPQEGAGARGSESQGVAKFGFEWPEVGDQYELLQDIPGHPKGSHVSAETLRQAGVEVPAKPAGHTEPTIEVVGDAGGTTTNASGESGASAEAMSRLQGMSDRGERFVVKRGNVVRPLVGPDAVDYQPRPGESFGIQDKDGAFRPLTVGSKTGTMSPEVADLIGNRRAGAMPLEQRQKLLAELLARARRGE